MKPSPARPWYRRAMRALQASLKLRLLLVFLLLALGTTFIFISGAQKAFSLGWREAARPLLVDYVDRLAHDVAPAGEPPQVERAQRITERLPVTIEIDGPTVQWRSHPDQPSHNWRRNRNDELEWEPLLVRRTADGHRIIFGMNEHAIVQRPKVIGYTLTGLLLLALLAYLYLRHLLRPIDDIRQGALRFGAGEFDQSIRVQHPKRPNELDELAVTVNTMGRDIHQMLEAQRTLLLAISHELRSPLTRARLNTELLPETPDVQAQRDALLSDLHEMARLISDLLESERLAGRHQALHREATAPVTLAHELIAELSATRPAFARVVLHAAPDVPVMALDRARVRLLLRNLLDNALRHNTDAVGPVELRLRPQGEGGQGVEIEVRDHGPGVPEAQLPHMAQAFFRPDAARTRSAGGVGLGLYLCRLVVQAHGGEFAVRNGHPGLVVSATLPPG